MFSDGFRGFILDHSKPPAKSGDEFKRASASHAGNSNTLKKGIIDSYMDDSTDHIESKMNDSTKNGSSSSKARESAAASYGSIGDHDVVKIND